MPSYPRIDVGNPYLTARYDGGVVDSLPWGRGWDADGEQLQQQVRMHAPDWPAGTRMLACVVLPAASDGHPLCAVLRSVHTGRRRGAAAAAAAAAAHRPHRPHRRGLGRRAPAAAAHVLGARDDSRGW